MMPRLLLSMPRLPPLFVVRSVITAMSRRVIVVVSVPAAVMLVPLAARWASTALTLSLVVALVLSFGFFTLRKLAFKVFERHEGDQVRMKTVSRLADVGKGGGAWVLKVSLMSRVEVSPFQDFRLPVNHLRPHLHFIYESLQLHGANS